VNIPGTLGGAVRMNANAYGGGMWLAPEAALDDGMLDVVIVSHVPKLRFLRLLPTVFRGLHVRQREVEVLRAREIEIRADRPFTLYADGDPLTALPATVRAVPAAIRVIVPASARRAAPAEGAQPGARAA